jgi:DNA-binding response OmpR family regulator
MTPRFSTEPTGHIQVLVVEDNRVYVDLVRLHLAAATDVNFDVIVAVNAQDGLYKLRNEPCDVVLLDLHLPNGEGLQLVHRFLEAADSRVPIVVTSAIDNPKAAAEIVAVGAAEFVAKTGYDNINLVPLLKAVVARHRSIKRIQHATKVATQSLYEVKETLGALKDMSPRPPESPVEVKQDDRSESSSGTTVPTADNTAIQRRMEDI